jgi:putative holliday junction resolvase
VSDHGGTPDSTRPDTGAVLGVDLGTRRIGLASTDSRRTMAFPHGVLERSGDPQADRARLIAVVADVQANHVVVGLPLSLDARVGPAAQRALEEIEALRRALEPLGVGVEAFDERFTTVSAHAGMARAGTRTAARRDRVDAAAATVLLQSWLEAR